MDIYEDIDKSDNPCNHKQIGNLKRSKTFKIMVKFTGKKDKNINHKNEEGDPIRKSLRKSRIKKRNELMNKILTKEDVYEFLSKSSNLRSLQEIHFYGEYLSNNFNYFAKLRAEDSQLKVEKITKICRLEKAFKGESIMNFGEIGDKFYIVLEGVVEIFKPKYVEIFETPAKFMGTLYKMREMDGNDLRFSRIKEKNINFFESLNGKKNIEQTNDFRLMKYKQLFIMEEDEKMGEYGEGFSFGDIALIKKTVRNATIKAKENCIMLTIEKEDYNKAIMEFQKKKLSKEIEAFVKSYSFFKNFSNDKIISLFNCFTKKELYKGEYLYKQNMEDDSIYILNSGVLSIYSIISFPWINDYMNYINYSGKNILQYIIKNRGMKIGDIVKLVEKCQSKIISMNNNEEKYELWEKLDEKQMKDNLYKLKKDEEKLNNPDYIFNINLKQINHSEIIGLEEVFEFKKRFCYCKCISDKSELKAIKIIDFLKLIINFGDEELGYLLHIINDRKKILKDQIIKGIENLGKKLIFNFDMRYDNIIRNDKTNCSNEEKSKIILSTIKMKGYKDSVRDILDIKVPILEKKVQKNKFLKKRRNKSSEALLKNYVIKKNTNNQFKLKEIKHIFKQNSNEGNKEESKMSKIFDMINKSHMNKINDNYDNINIRYFNKIKSNSCINRTKYTNDSLTTIGNKKKKKLNSNNSVKDFDTIINNDRNNTSHENIKINSDSSRFKKIKFKQNELKKMNRTTSTINFYTLKKGNKKTIRDSITTYESYNLPKVRDKNFVIKSNIDETGNNNSQILIKGNKDYNHFYNVYNEDKNFFLGVEFQKKLKNEFKYFPLNKTIQKQKFLLK